MDLTPMSASFFELPTHELAQALLGMILVRTTEAGTVSGRIVETEAYIGPEDRAAHSYGNRRTPRTEIMFGMAGHAYTYEMHTHCLLNVVSGGKDQPEAVLIRAIEPYTGIHLMRERRGNDKQDQQLTNGPGKLTKALGITKADYGHPLFQEPLYIAAGKPVKTIAIGPRIGIDNTGEAKHYPWRYWEYQNPYVSKPVKNITEIRYLDDE